MITGRGPSPFHVKRQGASSAAPLVAHRLGNGFAGFVHGGGELRRAPAEPASGDPMPLVDVFTGRSTPIAARRPLSVSRETTPSSPRRPPNPWHIAAVPRLRSSRPRPAGAGGHDRGAQHPGALSTPPRSAPRRAPVRDRRPATRRHRLDPTAGPGAEADPGRCACAATRLDPKSDRAESYFRRQAGRTTTCRIGSTPSESLTSPASATASCTTFRSNGFIGSSATG